MLLTIVRLAGSIATGIILNLFVNYLKKEKDPARNKEYS